MVFPTLIKFMTQYKGTGSSTFTVFQKNGMLASFSVAHPPNQPHLYNVTATFRNSTATPFVDFLLKAAVPKVLIVK